MIAPCAALLTLRRSPAVSTYAAVPIFTFWLLVMGLICLYILNTSDFTSGTYSGIERALTAAIGAACIYGLIGIARLQPRSDWRTGRSLRTATARGDVVELLVGSSPQESAPKARRLPTPGIRCRSS